MFEDSKKLGEQGQDDCHSEGTVPVIVESLIED